MRRADEGFAVIEPKELYRRYLAALAIKDPAVMAAALDDVLHAGFIAHDLPEGVRDGSAALKRFRCEVHAAFPDQTLRIDDLIEEGDRVAARLTAVGTHLGTFRGIPATGRLITVEIFDIVRIANERITERWTMFDRGGLLAELRRPQNADNNR